MNNIYFGQDPLIPQQYYNYNIPQQKDWVGELEDLTQTLDSATKEELSKNLEYVGLSAELSQTVQAEIMNLVRGRLNGSREMTDNIQKQIRLIKDAKNTALEKQRKSMAELNDYITNYSQLTFDEYKALKNEKKD